MPEKMRCYEITKCNKKECPAYHSPELRCWLIPGTHCQDKIQGVFVEKMEMCFVCDVFKRNLDAKDFVDTFTLFRKQIDELRQMVESKNISLQRVVLREKEARVYLQSQIVKFIDICGKVALGDLTQQIAVTGKDEIASLGLAINEMIMNLRITVGDLSNAKKELEELSRTLEKKVEERTKELTEAQEASLNMTQDLTEEISEREKAEHRQVQLLEQLEKINKELNDFAYVISHDLKAPLRGIKTLTEWITTDYADKLDENGKEQMSLLTNRVDRMHNLIDGVLQYSRVGRVKEDMVQINLNELIPEVVDLLAPPENISITIENELPTIKCERTRITQVFQNLLSNAVKYMDKPQGQIKVGYIEENGFWEFSIADNGPGIEEKYFEKIFQIFQTLSPRDESESTGIGLTVVKKIVEMYGGKIWVQSKVGEGSTFFFTLPKALSVTDNKKQLLTSTC